MKVLGIDDNSELFSLLLTAFIGILLFLFTYALHQRVMASKDQSDNKTVLTSKQLFNGISKENAKEITKLN